MKILVTGATGFIGQYVINELLKSGSHEIIATTRNLSKAKALGFPSAVRLIEFDLSNSDDNSYLLLESPDALIHLAWDGLPNYKGFFHMEKNLVENSSFIKNMIKGGLKNLTVTGTCFEYGMQEGELSEEMETQPTNPYGQAKDDFRKFIETLKSSHHFSFKWLRLFYMYGKGQAPQSLVSQLEKAALGGETVFNMSGGEQVRDFLPVEEVARAIVEVALQDKVSGVINCCSGKPVKVKDFVVNYLKQKKYQLKLNLGFYPYPDYEPMNFWGKNTKLSEVLNGKK
jgi:nucleoside-diphosphate-sugar epimerase